MRGMTAQTPFDVANRMRGVADRMSMCSRSPHELLALCDAMDERVAQMRRLAHTTNRVTTIERWQDVEAMELRR